MGEGREVCKLYVYVCVYVCKIIFDLYVLCIWQPERSPGYETIENGWMCGMENRDNHC